MNKQAFTLAEALVTLTIIGVIMAMVIPATLESVSDTSGLQFKKAFTDLQDAVMLAEEDTNSYVAPLNYDPVTYFVGVSPANLCTMISNQITTLGATNCSADSSTPASTNPSFQQINGVSYWNVGGTGSVSFKNGDTNCTTSSYNNNCTRTIWIDIDGKDKGKNTHGQDQFKVLLRYDGKVMLGTGDDWATEINAIKDSSY